MKFLIINTCHPEMKEALASATQSHPAKAAAEVAVVAVAITHLFWTIPLLMPAPAANAVMTNSDLQIKMKNTTTKWTTTILSTRSSGSSTE